MDHPSPLTSVHTRSVRLAYPPTRTDYAHTTNPYLYLLCCVLCLSNNYGNAYVGSLCSLSFRQSPLRVNSLKRLFHPVLLTTLRSRLLKHASAKKRKKENF